MYSWKKCDSNDEPNHNKSESQNTICYEYRISNVNADRQKDMTKIIGGDVRGSVHHSIIHIKSPAECNSVSKFYFIFI
jgi:hypothetical protein